MAAQGEHPGLPELMARAYDVREGALDADAVTRRIDQLRPYLSRVAALAGLKQQETIADAGCGAATLSLGLALRVQKPIVGGVDLSPKAIEAAQAAAAAVKVKAQFKEADVSTLSAFAPGASLVLAGFVLNLVPDKAAFLATLAATVAKDGRILVVDAFVEEHLPHLESAPASSGPVMEATFRTLVAAAGLKVQAEEDLTEVVRELHVEGKWPWAEVVRNGLRVVGWKLVKT